MRLNEKVRPKTLSQVIGQPPVRMLQAIVAKPYSCCIMLEGPPGCGKTAAALATAHDLGCYDMDTWPEIDPPGYSMANCTGLFKINGADLSVDKARELLNNTLRFRYGSKSGFNVLLIEEFEWVSKQCQVFLKTALETSLPHNLIVIATTNDPSGLGKALLQRFKLYHFSGGPEFSQSSIEFMQQLWEKEVGTQCPSGDNMREWGWDDGSFSLRKALDHLQDVMAVMVPR